MKSLQTKVNIVPVIAKADSLTKKELELLKANVLADIEKHGVKIYEFPICDSDDDESFKKIDEEIKVIIVLLFVNIKQKLIYIISTKIKECYTVWYNWKQHGYRIG